MELFPLTPANIYWCPKFLTNQRRSLSVALNEQAQRVKQSAFSIYYINNLALPFINGLKAN